MQMVIEKRRGSGVHEPKAAESDVSDCEPTLTARQGLTNHRLVLRPGPHLLCGVMTRPRLGEFEVAAGEAFSFSSSL